MEVTVILLEAKELDLLTVKLSQEVREAMFIILLYAGSNRKGMRRL